MEVSGFEEGVSLSIDVTSWAIRLASSAGRAAEVARKFAEVDWREGNEDNTVTETVWPLGSIITKVYSYSKDTTKCTQVYISDVAQEVVHIKQTILI